MRLFQKKVVPFLGAGCSVAAPSSIPSAGKLAERLAAVGAGDPEEALEDIAERLSLEGGWQAFTQLLPSGEWRARPPNEVFRVIAELCREGLVSLILTTNWDVLIEAALMQIGQPFAKVVDATSLAVEPVADVTLVKLNGCIDHPNLIKATRSQIESLDWLDAWIDALFDLAVRANSMLFAGYSGASRAATETIARLVSVDERIPEDFLVDRDDLEKIGSTESGHRFVEALNLREYTPTDAVAFFLELREKITPLLLNEALDTCETMVEGLVAPTAVERQALVDIAKDVCKAVHRMERNSARPSF